MPLFSVGHSNKSYEEFLRELKHFNIHKIVDIRSVPYSKYNPHFNKEAISEFLHKHNIKYEYLGNLLGGLLHEQGIKGKPDYNKIKKKQSFRKGLEILRKYSTSTENIAIMCAEWNPANCHRAKLIGEAMREKSIIITHIINHKRKLYTKTQTELLPEIYPYGNNSLFD